jgi:hypothetical protein
MQVGNYKYTNALAKQVKQTFEYIKDIWKLEEYM